MSKNAVSRISLSLGVLMLGLASAASASMNVELLRADFNDKPLNTQIGTGGASVGEPVSLTAGLAAQIKAAPFPTRSLHLREGEAGIKYARFEFVGSEEIRSGELRIAFTLRTPPALDRFRVVVGEQGGTSSIFGGLSFTSSGNISTIDANPTFVMRAWVPNETLHVELVYQVAAGSYDVFINGVQVLDDRPHGVPLLDNGIGAVLFGFPSQLSNEEWVVDDIYVVRTPGLLNADFDNRPLNTQIGAAGPTLGEPISVNLGLIAKVQAGIFATPALVLEQASTGSARYALFEFLNSREIVSGELRISFRMRTAPIPDEFFVFIREQGPGGLRFGGFFFTTDGNIVSDDLTGNPIVGSFTPGDEIFFEFRYAMDAGIYDLYINRVLVLDDRPHGVTAIGRGIGRIMIGTSPNTTSQWVVDDLYVYQPGVLFRDGFD